jgi:murein DD-endopeptidase MepM/ murein hydrolase activator NlpD
VKAVTHGILRTRYLIVLAITVAVVSSGLSDAWATDPADRLKSAQSNLGHAQEQLAHSTQALADATNAFQQATAKLPAAEATLTNAQHTLAVAKQKLETAKAEVTAARAADRAAAEKLAAAEKKVDQQKAKITDVSAQIDDKRESISQVAVEVYQHGSGGDLARLAAVLRADNLQDLEAGITASESIVDAQNSVLTDLKHDRARLSNERVVLEDLRAKADELRQQAAAQLAQTKQREHDAQTAHWQARAASDAAIQAKTEVNQLVSTRESAVNAAQAAKAADARQAAAWKAERDHIQAEIDEIERREREKREQEQAQRDNSASGGDTSSGGESEAGGGSSSAGGLQFPVANPYVTSPFGMRVHPITGVYKLHDGTDFRAYCNTAVHAAASGTVEWASYLGGYGNQVAVNHHQGMVTSYSHLDRFTVQPGQEVSQGEVIGYAGSTGYSTACHLHFMLYVNGELTNPMDYL